MELHPNAKIYKDYNRGNMPYMDIQKSRETSAESVACILLAGIRLESGEIKELIINRFVFNRKSFELKNGRWNNSSFVRNSVNALEIEALEEIANWQLEYQSK